MRLPGRWCGTTASPICRTCLSDCPTFSPPNLMDRNFWLLRGLRFFLFAALFVGAAVFGTQALWNWLMPALFHLPLITLGQTLGLLLLSRILFGDFLRNGPPGGWARRRKE